MNKVKRIAAILGVVLLISMYLLTLVSAVFASENAHSLFLASIFCTFVVPIMLYAYILVYKLVHKNENIEKHEPPEE